MGLFDLFPGRSTPNLFDVVKFVDAVTSDPVTEGKKDGYERAANEYEPIYQELKKEYEQAIAEIQRQRNAYVWTYSIKSRYGTESLTSPGVTVCPTMMP